MKTLLLAGATLALLTAVNLSPAMARAQAQTHSGGNSACADKHYEYQYHYGHNGHWEGQWVLVIVPQACGPHLDGAGTSGYGAGIPE
jgi:hypothetical protein